MQSFNNTVPHDAILKGIKSVYISGLYINKHQIQRDNKTTIVQNIDKKKKKVNAS